MTGGRRGLLWPSAFALAGLLVALSLGTWQLERKAWKETLIQTLSERLGAAAAPLPPAQDWAGLERATYEFRRVTFRAAFVSGGREARLFTGASALRDDIKQPGTFFFVPARLADGSLVVVNRGYAPTLRSDAAAQPAPPPPGPVEVTGVLRWPDAPGWFDNLYSATDDLWFVRDHLAMARQNRWGAVAPFYVEMEAPAPPGGLPRPGRIKVNLPNNHLQYAVTWYGLAAVLAVMFAIWVRSRRDAAESRDPA